MKKDLFTAIIVAVLGILGSYFICNLIADSVDKDKVDKVKIVNTKVDSALAEPDPEVFNYRAINPTVEVYVGNEGS